MKMVVEVAGEKICYILNRSLEEGIFPNEWKEAYPCNPCTKS